MNRHIALTAGLIALLAIGGCTGSRFSSLDSRQSSAPAPLTPAPAGTVTTGQLPPPTGTAQFPAPPTTPETQVAAVDPAAEAAAAAAAPDISAGAVAGVWNASVAGQSCRVATPQTKFGSGFRAGPLRCPAPIDGVKSWNVAGKQLSLYDQNGAVLARLYQSAEGKFDGQTTSGQPVSLSR